MASWNVIAKCEIVKFSISIMQLECCGNAAEPIKMLAWLCECVALLPSQWNFIEFAKIRHHEELHSPNQSLWISVVDRTKKKNQKKQREARERGRKWKHCALFANGMECLMASIQPIQQNPSFRHPCVVYGWNFEKSRNFEFCQMRLLLLLLRLYLCIQVFVGLVWLVCVFVHSSQNGNKSSNVRLKYLRCVPLSHVAHVVTMNSTACQDNNQKMVALILPPPPPPPSLLPL